MIKLKNVMGKLIYSILIGIFLFTPGVSFSFGLEVEPGEINIENVPLGEEVAVSALGGKKMKLIIKNKSADTYNYSIDILATSQTSAPFNEGYIDIPDISWIYPENKEVRIEGGGSRVVELYVNIPQVKEYYGKKYQSVIEVKTKKNVPEDIFVLACQLKMLFSTLKGLDKEARNEIK
ncbi:MAG: hypothetical protein ABIH71_06345 [Candidatus Omnitrophota bacterium]